MGAQPVRESSSKQSSFVSLNLGGTVLAVGDPWYDGIAGGATGRVRVFEYNGSGGWDQTGLAMEGKASSERIGRVAIVGTYTAIGALGRARVFDFNQTMR